MSRKRNVSVAISKYRFAEDLGLQTHCTEYSEKFRALFGTPKQIMCHNSKNALPISTKFQGQLNPYERHAVDTF